MSNLEQVRVVVVQPKKRFKGMNYLELQTIFS